MELGTDEHVKKGNLSRKMTGFWLSYVRVLQSMGSSASMEIRTSVYCHSMCSIGCGSSRRKSDGIIVVSAPSRSLGFLPGHWILPNLRSYRRWLSSIYGASGGWQRLSWWDCSQEAIAKPKRDGRPTKMRGISLKWGLKLLVAEKQPLPR